MLAALPLAFVAACAPEPGDADVESAPEPADTEMETAPVQAAPEPEPMPVGLAGAADVEGAVSPEASSAAAGAAPAPGPDAGAAAATVTMSADRFSPATVTIERGQTVVWSNTSEVVHTVTADDGSFDSGNLQPGQTFSRTFSAPGTYRYHCVPHRPLGMVATVVVK